MADTVLITGCNGFVGRHLCEYLAGSGATVVGTDRHPGSHVAGIRYRQLDIADLEGLTGLVQEAGIARIFHLAAVANPRDAQTDPYGAIRTNLMGSVSVLEACRKRKETRLLLVGSSEEYKKKEEAGAPLDESSELEGSNIYGVTKICAETLGLAYSRQFDCHVVIARSFNHTGPGQEPAYVLSDFARQCALINAGLVEPVLLAGNLDVYRDMLDVRDVVRAYSLLLSAGQSGEVYNVCSRQSYRLRDPVEILMRLVPQKKIRLVIDEERARRNDPAVIHGDSRRIRNDTGWHETLPIERTLKDLYLHWCGIVKENGL